MVAPYTCLLYTSEIAADYEEGGAAAISVLTEPYYFQGSNEYLKAVRQPVSIPILPQSPGTENLLR